MDFNKVIICWGNSPFNGNIQYFPISYTSKVSIANTCIGGTPSMNVVCTTLNLTSFTQDFWSAGGGIDCVKWISIGF